VFTERHNNCCKEENVFTICIHRSGRKFEKSIHVSVLPETMDIINFIHVDMKPVFKYSKKLGVTEKYNVAAVR
jgi:hypothetical protein